MTNHNRGSSLLQARKNHNHHHFHSHQHARSPDDGDSGRNHIRSPEEKLQNRQVVHVETVSVVQVIDEEGAVIDVSTLVSDPVTQLPDPQAAVTPLFSALDDALPTVPVPDLVSPDGTPSPIVPGLAEPTPPTDSLSSLSSQEPLTSAPLPSSSGFPILPSGIFNSTTRISSLFANSTALFTNSTRTTLLRSNYTAATSRTTGSSETLTSVFIVPTGSDGRVGGGNVGVDGAPTAFPPAATSTDSAPPPGAGLTPAAQRSVIGGVVGSLAGVALIALALMFILKWKRGRGGGLMLLGDSDSTHGGTDPSGRNGGGGMGERSIPFAIPSALASLTGHKRAIEDSSREPATGERGFYRVSGKKLISVLESGGDGYSDPHDSIISGTSDYRKSEAFIGGSTTQPLQLGSPMRPESGVPIMRSGPNRTPVQAQGPWTGPYSDHPRSLTPPIIDPLGRSLVTRHGSQGSTSRFSEPRTI